jgi:hypothetical protein
MAERGYTGGMRRSTLLLLVSLAAFAQNGSHVAVVQWTDTLNPAGTTYNVYRQNAACPPTPPTSTAGFTELTNAPVSGLLYSDSTVTAGTWSYVVTANVNGVQTGPSPCGQGTVPAAGVPPQSITVTIK